MGSNFHNTQILGSSRREKEADESSQRVTKYSWKK